MLQMRPHQGDDVWSTPSSIHKTFEALALNSTPHKKFEDEDMLQQTLSSCEWMSLTDSKKKRFDNL